MIERGRENPEDKNQTGISGEKEKLERRGTKSICRRKKSQRKKTWGKKIREREGERVNLDKEKLRLLEKE